MKKKAFFIFSMVVVLSLVYNLAKVDNYKSYAAEEEPKVFSVEYNA